MTVLYRRTGAAGSRDKQQPTSSASLIGGMHEPSPRAAQVGWARRHVQPSPPLPESSGWKAEQCSHPLQDLRLGAQPMSAGGSWGYNFGHPRPINRAWNLNPVDGKDPLNGGSVALQGSNVARSPFYSKQATSTLKPSPHYSSQVCTISIPAETVFSREEPRARNRCRAVPPKNLQCVVGLHQPG